MDDKLLQLIAKKIEERRRELLDHLGTGAPKDYSEYREVVGAVKGLSYTAMYIEDLMEQLKENNDE
jgi:hypothetical protein